jgi:cytochrome c oxidase subunit 2
MRPGRLSLPKAARDAASFGAKIAACSAAFFNTFLLGNAFAAGGEGHPVPGQMTFEEAVTPIAEEIHHFHDWLVLPIIIVICIFVAGLLAYVIFRFNEKANPTPSRTTHHSLLEVAWTIIPVLILVVIAIPSFRLLTHQLVIPKSDMTIKVTGKQWYWTYSYPADQGGGFDIDSNIKDEASLKPEEGDIRQLSVDNEAVVPVGKTVLLQITADDVIHSFIIQAFGVRMDAVPGRLNETWFKAEREGMYYGQCSKLCGRDHAYMPIAFRVVSPEAYATWLVEAKKKYASNTTTPLHFAGNDTPESVRR